MKLSVLYRNRFSGEETRRNEELWRVLCSRFFQRWVGTEDTVADFAAGSCGFINNIRCAKKYAVDLNEDLSNFANQDVACLHAACDAVSDLGDNQLDVVFMSNFLEHLPDKEGVLRVLQEAYRVLRPGGRVLVVQPNIRFTRGAYWDFFDHIVPLTEKSLCEALELAGFAVEKVIPRFLPYTTKGSLPKSPVLVRWYLALPLAWRILGQQSFVVARVP